MDLKKGPHQAINRTNNNNILSYYYLILSYHCFILSYYCLILSYYYLILSYYYLILSYYYLILSYYCLSTTISFLLFINIIVIGKYLSLIVLDNLFIL